MRITTEIANRHIEERKTSAYERKQTTFNKNNRITKLQVSFPPDLFMREIRLQRQSCIGHFEICRLYYSIKLQTVCTRQYLPST